MADQPLEVKQTVNVASVNQPQYSFAVCSSSELVCQLPSCAEARIYRDKYLQQLEKQESEISGLHIENQSLRSEISGLHDEISGLHDDNRSLRSEISGLHDEISGLHDDNRSLRSEISGLHSKLSAQEEKNLAFLEDIANLKRMVGISTESRTRLLAGQIAYCFLARLSSQIEFSNTRVSSIEQLLSEVSEEQGRGIISILEQRGLEYDFVDSILEHMKNERFYDAHPNRIREEDETEPSNEELKVIIGKTFNRRSKDSQKRKSAGLVMVDLLRDLSSKQGKGILDL